LLIYAHSKQSFGHISVWFFEHFLQYLRFPDKRDESLPKYFVKIQCQEAWYIIYRDLPEGTPLALALERESKGAFLLWPHSGRYFFARNFFGGNAWCKHERSDPIYHHTFPSFSE